MEGVTRAEFDALSAKIDKVLGSPNEAGLLVAPRSRLTADERIIALLNRRKGHYLTTADIAYFTGVPYSVAIERLGKLRLPGLVRRMGEKPEVDRWMIHPFTEPQLALPAPKKEGRPRWTASMTVELLSHISEQGPSTSKAMAETLGQRPMFEAFKRKELITALCGRLLALCAEGKIQRRDWGGAPRFRYAIDFEKSPGLDRR